ncbi:unnamed protein product, partial [Ixodes hexagonus]
EYESCSVQIFSFTSHDARGVPYGESKILAQLIRVVEMSQEKDVGLGVLTSEDRDVWAKAYDGLSQSPTNAESLEAIKRAALVVCLDGALAEFESYEVTCPQQIYMGGPNAVNAANRWWDKPVQVKAGRGGGGAVDAITETECCDKYPNFLHTRRFTGDIDSLIMHFTDYGKDFVKACNMSPDSYLQMALQLAGFRIFGGPISVVGAASSRKFFLGRVEGIHSTTVESVSFCRVFENPRSTRAEKEDSLRKAVEAHRRSASLVSL